MKDYGVASFYRLIPLVLRIKTLCFKFKMSQPLQLISMLWLP